MIHAQSKHVTRPPACGHTMIEDQPLQDAVVDPTIEKLFALSNAASDRTASPIDMQSVLFAALSRMDERLASPDSHAATPTTTETPHCRQADARGSVNDLLLRARAGDSAAWEEIVRRHSSVVFATVRSFRLQDADVLDAVQMTWLRLAENAHRLQYPERLDGWLATAARRECLRILRQQAMHTPTATDAVAENVADPCTGPEQRAVDGDTAQTLWKLVAELSPLRRTLLQALFTDTPRPYDEVARTAGIPLGRIGPTRARALRQLRRLLDERGLGA